MEFTETCSILAGAPGPDGTALVTVMNDGLAEERREHALPLLYQDGAWVTLNQEPVLPWLTAGIALADRSSGKFVIVGWAGQVLVVDGQESRREAIRRAGDHLSIVRSAAMVEDAVYAVGMRRQVHTRAGNGRWDAIDDGVAYVGDDPAVGFNAVDGFGENEIYCVGLNGDVWRREEGEWRQSAVPSNVHLHSVCCALDGHVYVGGRSGLLVRGRRDSWTVVDLETDETVWDLHWFGDGLYALLDDGIFMVTDAGARPVENDVIRRGDFLKLSSREGALWVFGRKQILRNDGSTWTEIDCSLRPEIEDADVRSFFDDSVLVNGSAYLEETE